MSTFSEWLDYSLILNSKKTGYSCDFVKQPPNAVQTDCPICLGILRDPYQAQCCGKCFCSGCYKRLKSINKACPTCNNRDFPAFEDLRQKHTITQFEVYCTHHNRGCQWIGELGELDRHLNEDPKPGAEKQGCGFIKVSCPHCHDKFDRESLNHHPFEECPRRHVHCTNIGKGCNWEGELADLALHLQTTCKANVVACPKKCGEHIHYQDVDSHMETNCPMKVVDCEFKEVGCEVRLPRKDIPGHLNNSSHHHLLLLMEKTHSLEAENTAKREEVNILREISTKQAQEIKQLTANVKRVQQEKASTTEVQQVQQAVKGKVSRKWLIFASSIAFLILALYIQYSITQSCSAKIAILENETDTRIDELHNELPLDQFEETQSDLYKQLNTTKQMISERLKESRDKTKNLEQEVRAVTNILDLPITLHLPYIHQGFSVHNFTLTKFKNFQTSGAYGDWYSDPFYSHPEGYKFQLNVDTSNMDNHFYRYTKGRGESMTVWFRLLKNKHDNMLEWPVSMTAHVQLLNQLGDHSHHERTSSDWWSKYNRGSHGGRIADFFKLSELKDKKKAQYLKNDCLKFRVYIKTYRKVL